MITENELKETNTQFNKLKLASHMRCEECDTYNKLYLDTVYLHNSGLIPIEDNHFLNTLLNDFRNHIKVNHPDRWEQLGDK